MNGYVKFDKYTIGWLNPYFTRTTDGDTDAGDYWIMSETTLNQLAPKEVEFEEWPGEQH